MCTLCFTAGSRPRVYVACEACAGAPVNYDRPCQLCRGRRFSSHEVSFECECDGCLEFRGEDHAGPVTVSPVFLPIADLPSLEVSA